MQWSDQALVLHQKPLGERRVILTLLTQAHGLHKGVFRTSKTTLSLTEPGMIVEATWYARLEDQLGTWSLEEISNPTAFLLKTPLALKALLSLRDLCYLCLPERESCQKVFSAARKILSTFSAPLNAPLEIPQVSTHRVSQETPNISPWLYTYVLFELALLEHTGITLDFKTCAATGTQEDLIYVSPRSGRAVSRKAGLPYINKLLPLPKFLTQAPHLRSSSPNTTSSPLPAPLPGTCLPDPCASLSTTSPADEACSITFLEEVLAGLDLAGYFLNKVVFDPHGLTAPESRIQFIKSLLRHRLKSEDENAGHKKANDSCLETLKEPAAA